MQVDFIKFSQISQVMYISKVLVIIPDLGCLDQRFRKGIPNNRIKIKLNFES